MRRPPQTRAISHARRINDHDAGAEPRDPGEVYHMELAFPADPLAAVSQSVLRPPANAGIRPSRRFAVLRKDARREDDGRW
jgi:hypothetical protein